MKTKPTILIAAMGLAVATAGTAQALPAEGDILGTDETAIAAALEAQGYEVLEVEREDGLFEAELLIDGAEYELEIDAETGAVLMVEAEEADDDDASEDGDDEDDEDDDA